MERNSENRVVMSEKADLTRAVLAYYDKHKRDLPWRDTGNPYYVWLSEIMLQQTRVEAVKGYFIRFIHALPDVEALAECEEEYLLKLWEGLGYYSRARNLKKAAQQVMSEFGGKLPQTKAELLTLAGIGGYTAGAIASIAFGKQEVALDGNLIRVFSRIDAIAEDFSKQSAKNRLEEEIRSYLPEDRAGDFNQAIMDIGATICLPNGKPLCEKCPVADRCRAHAAGTEQVYPLKKEKKARKIETRTIFIFQYQDKVMLRKRNKKGVLYGLWEFPSVEDHLDRKKAEEVIRNDFLPPHLEIGKIEAFLPAKHIFSHLEWIMNSYWVTLQPKEDGAIAESAGVYAVANGLGLRGPSGQIPPKEQQVWAGKAEIERQISLPSAFKVYQQSVQTRL